MDQNILKEFNRDSIELPDDFPVYSMSAAEYEDVDGDPAILINLIFEENTNPSNLSGEKILNAKRRIRDWFLSRKVDLFPYYHIEILNEEPAEDDGI